MATRKAKQWRSKQRKAGSGGSSATAPEKFTAPTPGLEDVFFTWGTAKDAVKFEGTVSALAPHIKTQPWKYSLLASKAMSSFTKSTIVAPDRPVRKY